MDNNIPRGNKPDKKPYHKPYHHRRKPTPVPQTEEQDSSPNGQVIVRGGRYDLPPSASSDEPIIPTPAVKPAETLDSDDAPPAESDGLHTKYERKPRRQRNVRKKPYRDRQNESSEAESDEVSSEPVEEVVLTANADPAAPTEGEILDELNSADTPEDVPEEVSAADEPLPEPEPEPIPSIEIIGVKFKPTGKIYYFDPDGLKMHRSDKIIVDTARGLEFGTVELPNRLVTEREVVLPLRKAVRRATTEDIERAEANALRACEAYAICGAKIEEHKLDMNLVDVEYTFDNSKLLFYFTADGRVDFRELVKDLASVFRTRIELRQIGIRDETKLLGGIGICGRPFCCKTFLNDFVQVSIKMAKEQSLSLNSAKISGACGRLMCCLRYEYETYSEEIKKTPRVDQIVSTPDGDGLVVESQPLAGKIKVRFTDRSDVPPKYFHRDEVTVIGGKGSKNNRQ